ncbi:MAG: DsbA family protein [Halobacteriaceae archaeon]
MSDERIAVYADYVCPFCYLGRGSLERYRAAREEPLAVEWRPFDLRADARSPDGTLDEPGAHGPQGAALERVQESVADLRERYDADEMLDLEAVPDVDSLRAQRVSQFVQERHPDRWPALDRGLYAALWEEGRDVGDAAVLADVAADAGFPSGVVDDALAGGPWEPLREAFAAARQAGVTGVPTFVADGHAARGAVPPAQLERLVEGAADAGPAP